MWVSSFVVLVLLLGINESFSAKWNTAIKVNQASHFFTVSEYSTTLSIVLPTSSQTLEVTSSHSIFQANQPLSGDQCTETPIYSPIPKPIDQKAVCFFASNPFVPFTLQLFTSFVNGTEVDIRVNDYSIKENVSGLVVRELCYSRVVGDLAEGKRYYEPFITNHLERNLKMYPQPSRTKTLVMTAQRSGTHLLERTFEEIMGEFICSFAKPMTSVKSQHLSVGTLRGCHQHTRLVFDHFFEDVLEHPISPKKVIGLMRNPIFMLDSLFNMILTKSNHFAKIEYDYLKDKEFADFLHLRAPEYVIRWKFLQSIKGIPRFWVRYEDIIANPVKEFANLMSFIDGVPVQATYFSKIKEFLAKEGLVSFYKSTKVSNGTQNSSKETKRNLWEGYPRHEIEKIEATMKELIEFFGYGPEFDFNLKRKKSIEPIEAQFTRENNRTMFQLLNYDLVEQVVNGVDLNFDQQRYQIKRSERERYQVMMTASKKYQPFIRISN